MKQAQTHLIVGPKLNTTQLTNLVTKNNYKTYDNDEGSINYEALDLQENDNVIIHAHGHNVFSKHMVELDTSLIFPFINILLPSFTSSLFKQISKDKIINIDLISCYGGAAIYDIAALSKWSTLITLTSSNRPSYTSLVYETLARSINFISSDNPFIKYASYIYTNSDTSSFAVSVQNNNFFTYTSSFAVNAQNNNFFSSTVYSLIDAYAILFSSFLSTIGISQFTIDSNQDNAIFISSIDSIKDFSSLGIIEWQNTQLDSFLKFCRIIQNKMNKQRFDQIAELLELFKGQ